jgi:predicted secreted protein
VLIYHRWLIMEKLGDSAAAAADRRRLESLGFQPDDSLF